MAEQVLKVKAKGSAGRLAQALCFTVLSVGGIVTLYPIIFCLFGTFASGNSSYLNAKLFAWPDNFAAGFKNFAFIFSDTENGLVRSLILTIGKIIWNFVVVVFTSVLAGYAFARMRFRFKQFWFLLLLSSMMIPSVALIVPQYIWYRYFPLLGGNLFRGEGYGLINNPIGLVITGWVNVYNIFLCRQSIASLPAELSESAKMDGAKLFSIVFRIHLPLILPILAVMFLNLFVANWSDYINNMIYMPNARKYWTIGNVIVEIMNVFSNPSSPKGAQYPLLFATCIVSMVPPTIVYVFVQKRFVEGLSMGAVKG